MIDQSILDKNFFIINSTADQSRNYRDLKKFYSELCDFIDKNNIRLTTEYSILLLPSIYKKEAKEEAITLRNSMIKFVGINGIATLISENGDLFHSNTTNVVGKFESICFDDAQNTFLVKSKTSLQLKNCRLNMIGSFSVDNVESIKVESCAINIKSSNKTIFNSKMVLLNSEINVINSNNIRFNEDESKFVNCYFKQLESKEIVLDSVREIKNTKLKLEKSQSRIGGYQTFSLNNLEIDLEGSVLDINHNNGSYSDLNSIKCTAVKSSLGFFNTSSVSKFIADTITIISIGSNMDLFWDIDKSNMSNIKIVSDTSINMMAGAVKDSNFSKINISSKVGEFMINVSGSTFNNCSLPAPATQSLINHTFKKNVCEWSTFTGTFGVNVANTRFVFCQLTSSKGGLLFKHPITKSTILHSNITAKNFSPEPIESTEIAYGCNTSQCSLPLNYKNVCDQLDK